MNVYNLYRVILRPRNKHSSDCPRSVNVGSGQQNNLSVSAAEFVWRVYSWCGDLVAGMAGIPVVPSIRERTKGGSIELKWESVHTNRSGPVLYIVDSRWNVGKHYSQAHMTPWQQIAQVTTYYIVARHHANNQHYT